MYKSQRDNRNRERIKREVEVGVIVLEEKDIGKMRS